MATLVCFHAHPDDEAIATGGTMAKAVEAGHRVVLVVATRGEHGEIVPGVLAEGEQLGIRRVKETFDSARIIGCDRVEFLGYLDSGMMGEPTNTDPYSFWSVNLEQAAHRLAYILREEKEHAPVVLTIYDDHGGYGHPDHIQVHRVGRRAGEIAAVDRIFQGTMNRDQIRRGLERFAGEAPDFEMPDRPAEPEFGEPESAITHAIDVSGHIETKRRCMKAHPSQIAEDSFFLAMPEDIFAEAFGTEWFVELDATRAEGEPFADDLFAGLE